MLKPVLLSPTGNFRSLVLRSLSYVVATSPTITGITMAVEEGARAHDTASYCPNKGIVIGCCHCAVEAMTISHQLQYVRTETHLNISTHCLVHTVNGRY